MTARDEILARVRAALAGAAPPASVPRAYRREGTREPAALAAQFAERLADYRAGVHHGLERLPEVLAGVKVLAVPPYVPAQWLAGYPGPVWPDPPVSDLDTAGVAVLTGCAVAIADTGTIVLDGGRAQGRRALTLVPDHHVCVVRADQIVATVPEALARLAPTAPLTFISGPSATSDIELNRIEGVHGPRRLDVVVAD